MQLNNYHKALLVGMALATLTMPAFASQEQEAYAKPSEPTAIVEYSAGMPSMTSTPGLHISEKFKKELSEKKSNVESSQFAKSKSPIELYFKPSQFKFTEYELPKFEPYNQPFKFPKASELELKPPQTLKSEPYRVQSPEFKHAKHKHATKPEDEFTKVVNKLDTPDEVAQYMQANFTYKADEELYGKDNYWATPQETFKNKGGDCEDLASWALYCLLADGDYLYNNFDIRETKAASVLIAQRPFDGHAVLLYKINKEFYYIDTGQSTVGLRRGPFRTIEKIAGEVMPMWDCYAICSYSPDSITKVVTREILFPESWAVC